MATSLNWILDNNKNYKPVLSATDRVGSSLESVNFSS